MATREGMGCGPSKTSEQGEAKPSPKLDGVSKPAPPRTEPQVPIKEPETAGEPQPDPRTAPQSQINVEFATDGDELDNRSQPLEKRWSKNTSSSTLKPQLSSKGSLGPTGVYVPSTGFRTSELRKRLAEKYDMPEKDVEKAMEFAESEEYVDVYCFTYCITGGPMEPTAFKVAGLQGMDKEAILQWATAPGNEDIRVLNPEEQKRFKRARDDFLVSQALIPEQEIEQEKPEDVEELTEAYRVRFEQDTENMTIEEVMEYFGVPEISKVAIHKHLHPARGSATATVDEIARRKAAHPIALDRLESLS